MKKPVGPRPAEPAPALLVARPLLRQPSRLSNSLAVNLPGDRLEQEADRIAAAMLRPDQAGATAAAALQVQGPGAGEAGRSSVPPLVEAVLADTGRPLDPAVRARFEPRFGRDFSRVRVHTWVPDITQPRIPFRPPEEGDMWKRGAA
jgi:hypothetical protein